MPQPKLPLADLLEAVQIYLRGRNQITATLRRGEIEDPQQYRKDKIKDVWRDVREKLGPFAGPLLNQVDLGEEAEVGQAGP